MPVLISKQKNGKLMQSSGSFDEIESILSMAEDYCLIHRRSADMEASIGKPRFCVCYCGVLKIMA